MNKEEKFIKYLDDQLTVAERLSFEEELSQSVDLQSEFKKYVNINLQISELKKFESNQLYFNSLLTRFREKRKIQSKAFNFRKVGFAFSSILMLVVSFMIFNLNYSENESMDLFTFTESLSPEEKIELLKTVNDETSTAYLIRLSPDFIKNNLEDGLVDIADKNQIAISYNMDLDNFEEIITAEEFENIYTELLSMTFFNEEKL
jgi:hypothetical protein